MCIALGEGKGKGKHPHLGWLTCEEIQVSIWSGLWNTWAVCALMHSWSDFLPMGDSLRAFLCKGHSLEVPSFWWTRSLYFLIFSLGWPSGKLIFTAWNWLSFVFLPFICRCLRKKLREIRQKFASTSWSNNISRNYWDLLKECLSQREASGLTVDASGLDKSWIVRFLVKLPGSFPPQCHLLRGGAPRRTATSLRGLPGLCSSGLCVVS